MHGPYINVLIAEQRSRHEGPVPPSHELVWLPWVGSFLHVMYPPTTGSGVDRDTPGGGAPQTLAGSPPDRAACSDASIIQRDEAGAIPASQSQES